MLFTILFLTTCIIAAVYPLCFLISARDPLKENFHHFHLGMPTVLIGIAALVGVKGPIPYLGKIYILFWFALLLGVCATNWRRQSPQLVTTTLVSLLGMYVFTFLSGELISYSWTNTFVGILGGFILCGVLFAMNLGHWYLNVHGLPIQHLKRSVIILAAFLLIRLIWDSFGIWQHSLLYQGDVLRVYQFLFTIDGFLLNTAVLFGTAFPLAGLYFVYGTLKVKSTQSATGILYVLLSSILIGDLTYKYYLIKYGIAL